MNFHLKECTDWNS